MSGYLEFRWLRKSLRADGPSSQTANTSSIYLCQHFSFIGLKLMAFFSEAVINMLASSGYSGGGPLELLGLV